MVAHSAVDQGSDPAAILQAAAQTWQRDSRQRPDGKTVTGALLALEQETRHQRRSLPVEALQGRWRLCFTAPKKAHLAAGHASGNGSGFYLPAIAVAHIRFTTSSDDPHQLTIENQLQLLSLRIRFTGPARYQPPKNLLAFDFTHLSVTLAGLPLYRGKLGQGQTAADFATRPLAQLPFFAFFAASSDYIAARGRGGGLALWTRAS